MSLVAGRVSGSKPEHKVGDKSCTLKSRVANPIITNDQVAAGFEKFYGSGSGTQLRRKRINWKHQDFHGGPQGRKFLKPQVHEDRQRGKACVPPIKRASPRDHGCKHFSERYSGVDTGPNFDRKKRVIDPTTGKRVIDTTSKSWEFHQLYGRLKQFGGKRSKAFHHGIFPNEKNYPPSHDKDGKWIDYSLVQYGGMLCDRGLRIDEEPAPRKEQLNKTAVLPRGAARRHQQQRKVNAINAGQASIEDYTTRRFNASRGRSFDGMASRGSVASRGGANNSRGSDWRDAKLAALRAELNSLQQSR